jgi:hypothetical protein
VDTHRGVSRELDDVGGDAQPFLHERKAPWLAADNSRFAKARGESMSKSWAARETRNKR